MKQGKRLKKLLIICQKNINRKNSPVPNLVLCMLYNIHKFEMGEKFDMRYKTYKKSFEKLVGKKTKNIKLTYHKYWHTYNSPPIECLDKVLDKSKNNICLLHNKLDKTNLKEFYIIFSHFVMSEQGKVLHVSFNDRLPTSKLYLSARFNLPQDYYKNPRVKLSEIEKHLITHHTYSFTCLKLFGQDMKTSLKRIKRLCKGQYKILFVEGLNGSKEEMFLLEKLCGFSKFHKIKLIASVRSVELENYKKIMSLSNVVEIKNDEVNNFKFFENKSNKNILRSQYYIINSRSQILSIKKN